MDGQALMAKDAGDRIRDALSDVGLSTPAVRAAEVLGAVGDKAAEVAGKVKKAFAPILPGQNAPPKRRGDIELPKDRKK